MILAVWLFWALVLLANYYRQIGSLLAGDAFAWQVLREDALASRGVWALWGIFILGGVILTLWFARMDKVQKRFSPAVFAPQGTLLAALLPLALGVSLGGDGLSALARPVMAACLVLAAMILLGNAILRWLHWQPENWRQQLLFAFTTGFAALSTIFVGLAGVGFYRPAIVSATVILALVMGGSDWLFWPRPLWQRITLRRPSMASWDAPGFLLAIIALAFCLALIGALAPEIENDALWYHLWLPENWLKQGQLVDLVSEYISLYPGGLELIFGAAMALGGPIAAKLIHFACLPLGALLVYELARRFLPVRLAWTAVAFFVTLPTVLWEATTAYVDLALALIVGLSIYAALQYADTRRRGWFLLTAANLGLALSVKHLALFALLFIAGGLALRLWLDERRLLPAFLPVAGLAALSLLFPLPWYLRSWMASGNPFFPDFYAIFGAFPAERWNQFTEVGMKAFKEHFGRPRTPWNLLTLPWDFTVHAWRYSGTFGPLLALFLPGLLLPRHLLDAGKFCPPASVEYAKKTGLRWLAAFCLLYLTLWASPISSFQFRFLLPLAPLLAVLAAAGLDRIGRAANHRWANAVLASVMSVLLLLNLPPLTALHEADRAGWENWLTHAIRQPPLAVVLGRETQEDYLTRLVPSYSAWQYINTHLPAGAHVLTFSGGDHLYSQRDRLADDATLARPAVWGALPGQEAQAWEALQTLGISHILFDKRRADEVQQLAIGQPALTADYTQEYEDRHFVLYRLEDIP